MCHALTVYLRPINVTILRDLLLSGYPTHKTEAWLAQLLKPVKEFFLKHSLQDSFEFVNVIRDRDLSNCTMASFDVASSLRLFQ